MHAYKTLLKNELKMSLRGMDMLIFAVCMPIVVLVILGIIYGNKPAFEGADYSFIEQSFGALCSIAICAGGVMGLPLVISDYREKKILKRYQATPIKPAFILLVEVSMYVVYALVSLITLFGIAFFSRQHWSVYSWIFTCYDFDVQHRRIGWRDCQEYKDSRHYCECALFPHVNIFRSNPAIRSDATCYAESSKHNASHTGYKNTKECYPRTAHRKCDRGDNSYARIGSNLRSYRNKQVSVGISK